MGSCDGVCGWIVGSGDEKQGKELTWLLHKKSTWKMQSTINSSILEWKDLPVETPTRFNGDVLDYENAVEELLAREAREEAGVEIDLSQGLKYINSVAFIRPDGTPVVLVKFAAPYKSGEVTLEKGAFTDFAWVNAEEAQRYDCIQGIAEEVKMAVGMFEALS